MKELRELYDKATAGAWYHEDGILYSFSVAKDNMIGETYNNDADLICAMHNALPELLDAWEMVQAFEWAYLTISVKCESDPRWHEQCPFVRQCEECVNTDGNPPCVNVIEYGEYILAAYKNREAQKIEGVE